MKIDSVTYNVQKQLLTVILQKIVLAVSLNSEEENCAGVTFLIKLQAFSLQLFWKKTAAKLFLWKIFLWILWFLRNFWEQFFINISGWLLINVMPLLENYSLFS